MIQQLSLGVRLRPASTFANYARGDNGPVLAALLGRTQGYSSTPLWIWGPSGCGRTHLLQAACAAAGTAQRRSAYLPLGQPEFGPQQLQGLESLALVCLDDLGVVAERPEWQEALFELYLGLQEREGVLVMAAGVPPAGVAFPLADLASRLRAADVWQLRLLAEQDQGAALTARAAVLGLALPAETLTYLQRRLPRDFAALCSVLDVLDSAALAAQRPLTVPFVRSVLDEISSPR